jgi:tetratricopeptide (TPR) repeat protein
MKLRYEDIFAYLNMKNTIPTRYLVALALLCLVGGAVGAYFGFRTREKTELPTISRRAGESSPSSEFLNAERAVQFYREQIQKNPGVVKNYVELAQLFLQEARVTGNHHEYIPKAQQLLATALKIAPDDFNAQLTQASLWMTLHRFGEAKKLAERCVAANAYSAVAYGVLCDALVELGEYERAVQTADKMIATRPDLRSYSRVAYLRELHGDLDGALEAMRLAANAGVTGTEQRAWVLYNSGLLLLQKNATPEAERVFKGILDERPHYPYALSGLARIEAARGEYFKAVNLLVDASHITPEHKFIEQISDVYQAMGENATASEMAQKALTAFAQHEQEGWNVNREYALFCLNHDMNLAESLTRAEQDYRVRPTNVDALDVYAFALYKNNRPQEAVQPIEQALRLNSFNPVLRYHAGLIFAAVGQKERGNAMMQAALKANLAAYTAYTAESKKLMAVK